MPLDKELKGTAGKDMGKQIARVAQDKDETVEFSKLGVMDKRPVYLCLFPWNKGERMISLGYPFTG